MKVKTSELTGAALAWAVFVLEGRASDMTQARNAFELCKQRGGVVRGHKPLFAPHLNWDQGGPIIEREGIATWKPFDADRGMWKAHYSLTQCEQYGPTPLIAAMRCYVMSKLGDEADVPDELMEEVK